MLREILQILKDVGFEELIVQRLQEVEKEKLRRLEEINQEIQRCVNCELYKGRNKAVLGEGNPFSNIMFIGEAPGEEEDLQGRPFVGKAGQLLTQAIERAGLRREEVYIANINKCRPPENRQPTIQEQEACLPFLERQIEIVNPKVLCLLGATAYRGILKTQPKITQERGKVLDFRGRTVFITYHPAYVLRNPTEKETFFRDIKTAIELAI